MYLGEQRSPDRLNFWHIGGLQDGLELIRLYKITQKSKNQSVDVPFFSIYSVFHIPYCFSSYVSPLFLPRAEHTVISTPSSARIKAAYETASSEVDIVREGIRWRRILCDAMRCERWVGSGERERKRDCSSSLLVSKLCGK